MKFRVDDMTCAHCTAAIEKAVAEAGGTARADLASKTVTVDAIDAARAAEIISAEGYTPVPLD